uniref:Uncharacterized protein n=1 Tax=Glycine max TaxID=3847 RepID=K7L3L9_SOYBN
MRRTWDTATAWLGVLHCQTRRRRSHSTPNWLLVPMEGLLGSSLSNTKQKEMLSPTKTNSKLEKPRLMLSSRPLRLTFWPIPITTNPLQLTCHHFLAWRLIQSLCSQLKLPSNVSSLSFLLSFSHIIVRLMIYLYLTSSIINYNKDEQSLQLLFLLCLLLRV